MHIGLGINHPALLHLDEVLSLKQALDAQNRCLIRDPIADQSDQPVPAMERLFPSWQLSGIPHGLSAFGGVLLVISKPERGFPAHHLHFHVPSRLQLGESSRLVSSCAALSRSIC